jgi:hypothetical protein
VKITVGQVLIVVGLGTYVVLGPLQMSTKLAPMLDQAKDIAKKLPYLDSLLEGKQDKKAEPPMKVTEDLGGNDLAVGDRMPAGEVPAVPAAEERFSEVPLTPVGGAQSDQAAVPAPAEKAAVVMKDPQKPGYRRRRKAVAVKETAKKSTGKAGTDPLVGNYVALKLKSGNVVKGILLQRTSTNYKIELPGMGGFDYPADTVKSIAAAE